MQSPRLTYAALACAAIMGLGIGTSLAIRKNASIKNHSEAAIIAAPPEPNGHYLPEGFKEAGSYSVAVGGRKYSVVTAQNCIREFETQKGTTGCDGGLAIILVYDGKDSRTVFQKQIGDGSAHGATFYWTGMDSRVVGNNIHVFASRNEGYGCGGKEAMEVISIGPDRVENIFSLLKERIVLDEVNGKPPREIIGSDLRACSRGPPEAQVYKWMGKGYVRDSETERKISAARENSRMIARQAAREGSETAESQLQAYLRGISDQKLQRLISGLVAYDAAYDFMIVRDLLRKRGLDVAGIPDIAPFLNSSTSITSIIDGVVRLNIQSSRALSSIGIYSKEGSRWMEAYQSLGSDTVYLSNGTKARVSTVRMFYPSFTGSMDSIPEGLTRRISEKDREIDATIQEAQRIKASNESLAEGFRKGVERFESALTPRDNTSQPQTAPLTPYPQAQVNIDPKVFDNAVREAERNVNNVINTLNQMLGSGGSTNKRR